MNDINELIDYIVKANEELQEKNYGIEPNTEYQITNVKKIIKCVMVELTDEKGNTFDVDGEYLGSNFTIICKMD